MKRLTISGTDEYVHCNIDNKCTGRCGNCPRNIEIRKKLRHYENLEEQNKLIKLPCKVGDTVYNACPLRYGEKYHEDVVNKIIINENGIFLAFRNGLMKHISCIGNSLFLSQEKAEKH